MNNRLPSIGTLRISLQIVFWIPGPALLKHGRQKLEGRFTGAYSEVAAWDYWAVEFLRGIGVSRVGMRLSCEDTVDKYMLPAFIQSRTPNSNHH
jgi:hypothetical protein